MTKKIFIFDLDGTLVDAYPAIVKTFNFTMRSLGYPRVSPQTIKNAVGWGDIELLRGFVEPKDLKKAIRVYRAHHGASLKRLVRLEPYALALLLCLKAKGAKLAIASNRPTRFTRLILKKLNIDSLFDCILCADRCMFPKPHPFMLNRILKVLRLPKKSAFYVGDMVLDVVTGRRAGIDTIAVATGSSSWLKLKNARPKHIFRDLKEMKETCVSLTDDE